jgi:hypothetical protein
MSAVYMECSAKERIGVDDIFDSAIILATSTDEELANGDEAAMKMMAKSRRRKLRKGCKFL